MTHILVWEVAPDTHRQLNVFIGSHQSQKIVGLEHNPNFLKPQFAEEFVRALSVDGFVLNFCVASNILTVPVVATSMVPIRLRKVVLPPPEGPRMTTN